MIKIILVDDDNIVVSALKTILTQDKDINILATGSDGVEAVSLYDELMPDVLLMDIRMKHMTGLEAAESILKKHKCAKILFLTTFDTDEYIISALRLGAKGYILKQEYENINLAIKLVHQNGRVFGDKVIDKVKLVDKSVAMKQFDLTDREMEIITHLANGLSNKEIAASMFLSEGTLRNYLTVILEKLNLRDRTQLAIFYYKNLQ